MAQEDVYNLSEIDLFYRAQPNSTLTQGKVCGRKFRGVVSLLLLLLL